MVIVIGRKINGFCFSIIYLFFSFFSFDFRFISSCDRPNLNFCIVYEEKRSFKSIMGKIAEFISRFKGKSGIIYCLSKMECGNVAGWLADNGIKAKAYHADMTDPERYDVQLNWMRNVVQVIDCFDVCVKCYGIT